VEGSVLSCPFKSQQKNTESGDNEQKITWFTDITRRVLRKWTALHFQMTPQKQPVYTNVTIISN